MRVDYFARIGVAFFLAAGLARAEKPVDAKASSGAIEELAKLLKGQEGGVAKAGDQPFASVPLSKEDSARARALLWEAHVDALRKERALELEKKELKEGTLVMPFSPRLLVKNRQPAGAFGSRCTEVAVPPPG